MPQEAQAALEQAVVNALQAAAPTGLGLRTDECRREYDGQPPAMTNVTRYVAVWSDGAREAGSLTSMKERMGVNVTATLRIVQPKDRMVQHRDAVTLLLSQVRAVIGQDVLNWSISNAAMALAGVTGYGSFGVEPLHMQRFGPVELKGPEWFSATRKTTGQFEVAVAQTAYFVGAMRVQYLQGMSA